MWCCAWHFINQLGHGERGQSMKQVPVIEEMPFTFTVFTDFVVGVELQIGIDTVDKTIES